jgi:hypothetical protein
MTRNSADISGAAGGWVWVGSTHKSGLDQVPAISLKRCNGSICDAKSGSA